MGEGRTTRGTQLISHEEAVLGNAKKCWRQTTSQQPLRIVDRTAEALFAGHVLQVFQPLLLLLELALHGFQLLFLLLLVLIPLHAVGNAVATGILDGIGEIGDLALQGTDVVLPRLNLALPILGRYGSRCGGRLLVAHCRSLRIGSGLGRADVLGDLVVRNDSLRLRLGVLRLSILRLQILGGRVFTLGIFAGGVFWRGILSRGVFRGCVPVGLGVFLLLLQARLAGDIAERRRRVLTVSGNSAKQSDGCERGKNSADFGHGTLPAQSVEGETACSDHGIARRAVVGRYVSTSAPSGLLSAGKACN